MEGVSNEFSGVIQHIFRYRHHRHTRSPGGVIKTIKTTPIARMQEINGSDAVDAERGFCCYTATKYVFASLLGCVLSVAALSRVRASPHLGLDGFLNRATGRAVSCRNKSKGGNHQSREGRPPVYTREHIPSVLRCRSREHVRTSTALAVGCGLPAVNICF